MKMMSDPKTKFDRFVKIPVTDNRDIEGLLKLLHTTVWKERLTIHWVERSCSDCKYGKLGAESNSCSSCVYDSTHPNWEPK